ncbi:MAG TPA: hypothetical protein VE344_00335 [Methylomirabilota bacterium]|nr:hypothetical protein [Methylomirabilota bacterium]
MKSFGKIVVCLAGWLALNASSRADDLALNNAPLPDNPYAPIIARNIFNLNPPTVAPAEDPNPPLKITPNGIMSVFGKLQVLFKVAGVTRPGQPAKDEYYTLSEGERQDDIEIMQIDDKKSLITFKNHGIVQTLPLASAPSNGIVPSSSISSIPLPPGIPSGLTSPVNNNYNGGGTFGRFGQRGRPGRGGQNNQENTGATTGNNNLNDNVNLRSVPTRIYQPEQTQIPQDQIPAIIEQQRAALLDMPPEQRPYSPNILPPTPLTGQY